MQILTDHMLKWDTKTKIYQEKELLGTVRAFASANEEQGQKHSTDTGKFGWRKSIKH
jgi:hypothetical protein